jgi:hypothetical protein
MKNRKIAFIILVSILFSASLHAMSLDRYISKMQHASPQKRVKMMNALKKTLAKMNSSDRARAIRRLRSRTTRSSVEKGNNQINSHLSRVVTTQQMSQSLNTQQLQVVNQAQIENIFSPNNQPSTKDFFNDRYIQR